MKVTAVLVGLGAGIVLSFALNSLPISMGPVWYSVWGRAGAKTKIRRL